MSSLTESLYLRSPILLQQLSVALYGWWWYHRRFNSYFHRLVTEFKAREYWTADQFRNYQEGRLDEVLEAAWESPYYRDVFRKAGIKKGIPPLEALARLPLLSKETLRMHSKQLLTRKPPFRTIVMRSSGTTGTPTEIYYTPEFHALEMATTEARNHHWAGLNYRGRRVMFGVRKVCRFDQNAPPFWRFSPVENMAYASIYHLSPKFLPSYTEFLRTYKPATIEGYPSALATIARYALDHNDLPAPAKAIFTLSETLSGTSRHLIETAWNCKVFDRYGAVEGCLLASQCEFGRYHVSPEVGIVEIIDRDGQAAAPGVMGEVICTGLQNTLQPLMRYRIGDIARWAAEQSCPCQRNMPVLEAIEGRFEDMCFTRDGREVLRFDTVFKGVDNIREAQVVQDSLDRFTINVIPAYGFNKRDIEKIQNNMELHFGKLQIEVKCVDAIQRSESGKFRAVICNLSRNERARI